MRRNALLELLGSYRPFSANDAAACERIAAFVRATPDCFERSHIEGHVTGSAWILDAERDRCLLTHHRKLGRWLQLGGHADGDPDIVAVALREAREESGLTSIRVVDSSIFDCDVHAIPERKGEPAHLHYDVRFLLEADPAEALTVSEESRALAWVPLVDVAALCDEESMMRMVARTPGAAATSRQRIS
ncbi:MAG TPA: NUDIX hydrolase [Candidatus Binatia bacterium]|jgi:8-oxo-dGTP pyrophosphatase MutT (NUDIX family)